MQIFAVGEQDGQPYIVLELIEGGSLAQRVNGNPLTATEAARLVETLARAVHAAHERGVVHRDLKPANILLSGEWRVANGEKEALFSLATRLLPLTTIPKITDFGLAKQLAEDRGQQTATGAIVGTPSYMAPEQAEGRTKEVGPATDIYALGVLLYELLTGRPPIRGATYLDTLKQVAANPPVPPRRLQPTVPRDLETVCLKCLEKDPHKRYGSAHALAEELRRFLAGEPVQARPVGAAGRLWRWCHRQPVLAGLCLALAVSVAAGFVAVTWQWRLAEAHFQESEHQRGRAEENLAEAQQQWRRAEKYLAEAQRERADARAMFNMAHSAVKDVAVQLSEGELARLPGVQPIRQKLLETARGYYEEFLKRHGQDPALRAELADTHFRLGLITTAVGAQDKALARYRAALALYEELLRADPGNAQFLAQQAHIHNNMGFLHDALGQIPQALEAFQVARTLHEKRLRARPDNLAVKNDLAATLSNIGAAHAMLDRPTPALDSLEQARTLQEQLIRARPDEPEYRSLLANTLNNLGVQLGSLGRRKDALERFKESCALREALARRSPKVQDYQSRLAESYRNLGDTLRLTGEPEKALQTLQKGNDVLEGLIRANPSVPFYQSQMSANLGKIGHALMETTPRQPARALDAFDRARAINERLTGLHPEMPWHQNQLGWDLYNMAHCHFELKDRDRELSCYERARDVLVRLVKGHPDRPNYHDQLSVVLNDLGLTYWQLGDPQQGRKTLRQAVEHARQATEKAGHVGRYRNSLDLAYRNLAAVERELGLLDESAATIGKRQKLWPGDAEAMFSTAREYALTAAQAGKGKAPSADDKARRRWYTGLALDTLRRAVASGFRDVQRLRSDQALESVRTQDEFRQLLAELDKKGGP